MIAAIKPLIANDSELIRGRLAGFFEGPSEADTADWLFDTSTVFEALLELVRQQATLH